MNKKLDPQLLEFAKTMRHTAIDAENLMWQILGAKQFMDLKFRRQHVIQVYIVDFYCHEIGLVIELDTRKITLNTQILPQYIVFITSHMEIK